uniref:Uncharacterized protein n=1 Tax=Arundo donax TaxID=35708 RepID=A0A0A9D9Q3_ARUDO
MWMDLCRFQLPTQMFQRFRPLPCLACSCCHEVSRICIRLRCHLRLCRSSRRFTSTQSLPRPLSKSRRCLQFLPHHRMCYTAGIYQTLGSVMIWLASLRWWWFFLGGWVQGRSISRDMLTGTPPGVSML